MGVSSSATGGRTGSGGVGDDSVGIRRSEGVGGGGRDRDASTRVSVVVVDDDVHCLTAQSHR